MKVYVSGPMSGLPEFNYPAFFQAAEHLEAEGYEVVNPASFETDMALDWEHYMRRDIAELVECDVIALLPGWEKSRGATLELYLATQLKMDVMHL